MIFENYLKLAYIHCIHYLARRTVHWTEKLFWIICILISMICAYLVIKETVVSFNEQTVSTTVDTSYLHWKTSFPAIFICLKEGLNIINRLNSIGLKVNQNVIDNVEFFAHYGVASGVAVPCRNANISCIVSNFSYYTNVVLDRCEDIFTSCYYNNKEFDCCSPTVGFQITETYYGKCFSLNSLNAIIKSRHKQYNIQRGPNLGYGNLSVETRSIGLYLSALSPDSIITKSNIHKSLFTTNLNKLTPGQIFTSIVKVTEVITSKEVLNVEDIEKRLCVLKNRKHLKRFKVYSESACSMECLIKAQFDICNCTVHLYPNIDVNEECDMYGLKVCLRDEKTNNFIEEKMHLCNCQISCREMLVSQVGFYRNEMSLFRHNESVTRFDIYVPAPTMRIMRFITRTQNDLIVAVGGILGLFLGFTFISIIQFLVHLFVRPITDWYRLKKHKNLMEKQRKIDERLAANRRMLANQHNQQYYKKTCPKNSYGAMWHQIEW